ncbi:hypothetical protein L596_020452 [Steinernema carpocapsae]|uniref:Uncharacterized protein n=1 Tax=Steinernema carpocapsae TaxID=34508 RepID=A0A4U5MTK9_STECR|nr:hypothetical protein L596_020452 [Steinernema carpocapsae]
MQPTSHKQTAIEIFKRFYCVWEIVVCLCLLSHGADVVAARKQADEYFTKRLYSRVDRFAAVSVTLRERGICISIFCCDKGETTQTSCCDKGERARRENGRKRGEDGTVCERENFVEGREKYLAEES